MELRSRRTTRRLTALCACVLATLGATTAEAPAQGVTLERPASETRPPASHRLSARRAIRAAQRSERVRAALADRPGLKPVAYTRGQSQWQVSYYEGDTERVQVYVDDTSGSVLETWTGPQVKWRMARGYEGAFGRRLTEVYVWLPLCLAFLVPFVDPRRPFRLLHLDLLVLLGFAVSHGFFNRGEIFASVPLAYPVLAYLFVRLLILGLRRRRSGERLVPVIPVRWLAFGLAFLVAFRVGFDIAGSNVIDVGYAGVIGADRIADGEPLYEGGFPQDNRNGDTYGPVSYLAYLPFEQVLPWGGRWDGLPAAHAASIAFDLLTLAGLLLLGRRLRAGAEGRRLGICLAYAWASYPYTLFVLASNTNDSLVALLLVLALLVLSSPLARGAVMALAGLTKLAPLALVPLLAAGTGERRLRSALYFGAAFVVTAVACLLPFVPDGGLPELYQRTMGHQLTRESPFSLWGQYPSLAWLQATLAAAVVALAVLVAFIPRRRDLPQIAALGAALLIGLELTATHWFYLYIVWFAPLALVALLAPYGLDDAPTEDESAPIESGSHGPGRAGVRTRLS